MRSGGSGTGAQSVLCGDNDDGNIAGANERVDAREASAGDILANIYAGTTRRNAARHDGFFAARLRAVDLISFSALLYASAESVQFAIEFFLLCQCQL